VPRPFKHTALRQPGQGDVAAAVGRQQLVHKLIHVQQLPAGHAASRQFTVVDQHRLQVLVHVHRSSGEAHVEHPERPQVFVIILLDELNHNLLVGLDLQHFEYQADERRWFGVVGVRAADVLELHRLVDQRFCVQAEAVLFPVLVGINTCAQNLFHQVLWICPVH
jgi:hypothetical protein